MILEPGKGYRIEGTFVRKDRPINLQYPPIFFQGAIVIADDLDFKGVIVDRYGPSEISGSVGEDNTLMFAKRYDITDPLYRGGSKNPILYGLKKHDSGGWLGQWYIQNNLIEKRDEDEGSVSMAIYPWDHQSPVVTELKEYLATKSYELLYIHPTRHT